MNRRSFFALAGVTAPLPSLATTDPPPEGDPVDLWWPMVNEVDRCRAVSSEGTLALEVSMARPGEEELEVITEGPRVVGYSLRGRRLLDGFFPGVTVVESFSLFWDDQPIPIPPRFWNDLAGFRIQTLGVDMTTLDLAQRERAEQYAARLDRPRIVLSADAGTALIEWVRREEFDSKSTFRWIISRAGNVLRHRERPSRAGLR